MQRILVIDDDKEICLLLKRFLTEKGFHVSLAYSCKHGLELLAVTEPDLIMCDFRLDFNEGKVMLLKIQEMYPRMPVIIISAYTDIHMTVEMMKLGAEDYITKPLVPDELLFVIERLLRNRNFSVSAPLSGDEQHILSGRADPDQMPDLLFSHAIALPEITQHISHAAASSQNIMLCGESGTGKEVIAREIHNRSSRRENPFAVVRCGALPKEIAAKELFGEEADGFKDYADVQVGIFEQANGGTVFLDEVCHLSHEIQDMLLDILAAGKMPARKGYFPLNVRLISASSEKLWEAVQRGKFREALFNRLEEYSIDIPPLRERKEDIALIASHFLHLINRESGRNVEVFSPEVINIFHDYIWYGNLRELRNVVRKAVLLTDNTVIEDVSLPFEISNFTKLLFEKRPAAAPFLKVKTSTPSFTLPRPVMNEITLKEVSIDAEYEMILEALKQTDFNKSKAARVLNIDRKTLYNKMRQYQQLNNH